MQDAIEDFVKYVVDERRRNKKPEYEDVESFHRIQRSNLNSDEACGIVDQVKIGG